MKKAGASGRGQLVDGGGGVSGYSGGNGAWEIAARGQKAVLRLKFHDGRLFEYLLSYEDRKTYLDDKRYFRTFRNDAVAEHRPQCW